VTLGSAGTIAGGVVTYLLRRFEAAESVRLRLLLGGRHGSVVVAQRLHTVHAPGACDREVSRSELPVGLTEGDFELRRLALTLHRSENLAFANQVALIAMEMKDSGLLS